MKFSGLRTATAAMLGTAMLIAIGASSASASTVTFEDFNTVNNETYIGTTYGGLDWTNFSTRNTATAPAVGGYPISNHTPGGHFSAFNVDGDPASFSSATTFNLVDAYFTAGFRNGLQLTITGTQFGGGTLSTVLTLNTTSQNHAVLNWANLLAVSFSTSGGTDIGTPILPRMQFAVDDIQVTSTVTPLPGSLLLLLTGFGALGAVGFKRRRDAAVAA